MKKIPKNIKLETKRLILRPVWFADPKDIQKQANDFEIANCIDNEFPFPFKLKNALNLINKSKEDWNKKNKKLRFAIYKKDTNEFIGSVGICLHAKNNLIESLYYWFGKRYWNRGYATEILKRIVDFCFKDLKIRKIIASAYSSNKASQKVLLNCKFEIEGIIKKATIQKDGKIVDDILFGKLNKSIK